MKIKEYQCIKDFNHLNRVRFNEGENYLFNFKEGSTVAEFLINDCTYFISFETFCEHFEVVPVPTIPKPYCNPYSLAKKAYDDTQITQIQKGLKKYNTPLHPSNHSSEELFNHAFEELVDLTHYISAYHYKMHHIKERLQKSLATGDPDMLAEGVQEVLDMIGDTV